MKQKLSGMTGAAIEDEAGDVADMSDDEHDDDHDENGDNGHGGGHPRGRCRGRLVSLVHVV
jgi:hypothetical protein